MIKSIISFALLLSVIVSIHELGHLIAAKIFNVYCEEYSLGMGPKLFSKKGKETTFSIRAFPFGGFVAMAGDNDNSLETSVDTSNIPFERTLTGIKPWKRIVIMLAGIVMNLLLAVIIYSLLICHNGVYVTSTKPVITSIQENMPAYNSGLQSGDIVVEVAFDNGISFSPETYSELISFTSSFDGKGSWHIKVNRNDEILSYDIEPIYNQEEDRFLIGIGFADSALEYAEVNIFNCWHYGIAHSFFIVRLIFSSLASLFTKTGLSNLSGPIGIYQTVEEAISYGLDYYLELIAMISINVGIFNAFPLPIFDGGRVFLTLIEMIAGKPLNKKAEQLVMNISLAILMVLFVIVSFNDIFKLLGH